MHSWFWIARSRLKGCCQRRSDGCIARNLIY